MKYLGIAILVAIPPLGVIFLLYQMFTTKTLEEYENE